MIIKSKKTIVTDTVFVFCNDNCLITTYMDSKDGIAKMVEHRKKHLRGFIWQEKKKRLQGVNAKVVAYA